MDLAARRHQSRKVLAVVLATPLLIAAGSWIWLKSVEARRWSRMERRVAQLRQENDARLGPHPVLRGESIAGDAWDDYLRAIELLKVDPGFKEIRKFVERLDGADRSKAESALAQSSEALGLLRRGTRRAQTRRVRLHEEERPGKITDGTRLSTAACFASVGVGQARLLREQGRFGESGEILLDLCRFAEDVSEDASSFARLYGSTMLDQIFREIKEWLCERSAPQDDVRRMDDELAKLDALYPRRGPELLGELEDFGNLLLNDNPLTKYLSSEKQVPAEARPGWRHAFSERLLMTTAFDRADAFVAKVLNADTGWWVTEQMEWKEIEDSLEADKNIYLQFFEPLTLGWALGRGHLTQLRLVRIAAHYYATGGILELQDPFGTILHHVETSKTLRIWGNGPNGVDDQGKGEWPWRNREDIVLEISRR